MVLECGLPLIRYSLLCINYTCKSPVFRNNRNNLSLSENCNCKHNITIHQLFQMERSRLREGSSLFDHILIGKSLHYRFGLWTLLPLITLQVFFTSCLFKEYLFLTHLSSQSLTSFWRRASRSVLWKNTMSPAATFLKTENRKKKCSDLQIFHELGAIHWEVWHLASLSYQKDLFLGKG